MNCEHVQCFSSGGAHDMGNDMGGACSTHRREIRNAYETVGRKPDGKIPLERCRHRHEGNVRNDLEETGQKGVD
jgi:hypothetical protein